MFRLIGTNKRNSHFASPNVPIAFLISIVYSRLKFIGKSLFYAYYAEVTLSKHWSRWDTQNSSVKGTTRRWTNTSTALYSIKSVAGSNRVSNPRMSSSDVLALRVQHLKSWNHRREHDQDSLYKISETVQYLPFHKSSFFENFHSLFYIF